jgi:hypothetical protein
MFGGRVGATKNIGASAPARIPVIWSSRTTRTLPGTILSGTVISTDPVLAEVTVASFSTESKLVGL